MLVHPYKPGFRGWSVGTASFLTWPHYFSSEETKLVDIFNLSVFQKMQKIRSAFLSAFIGAASSPASTCGTPPAWQTSLECALKANPQPSSSYFQLASVREDGTPAVRTLVFRGFEDSHLLFTFDSRSEKVSELYTCFIFTNAEQLEETDRIKKARKVFSCDCQMGTSCGGEFLREFP